MLPRGCYEGPQARASDVSPPLRTVASAETAGAQAAARRHDSDSYRGHERRADAVGTGLPRRPGGARGSQPISE